ncbi:Testis-expressed protein 10 [Seminavis robusta]|uniref:Testis-expressed protein 10 n=1 Tax=Seminavis robusta TaxID=568900 RepID=A0A9N8DHQ8_9STRA|nr:Testis-expressed protein 10 [Seminavis robusta]|eukprot:Sro151_g069260.1 Testis-expressed protein 10 (942) ;mRNA; f:77905-80730
MPSDKSNNKRKKKDVSDFKRVKAKVGKRALKPANETDTSFKTSRVAVSGNQFGSEEDGSLASGSSNALLSSRGRSLDDLVSHLRHPAAAVRISAAKGLRDAIAVHQASLATIRHHLPVLFPVCAKCCIDEDGEVRQLALSILKEIVSRMCNNNDTEDQGANASHFLHLKPFIPLLMAHVLSTLNSLDRSVQKDGVMIVRMLSATIHPLITPYKAQILSAFVSIFSDKSRHVRTNQFTKGTDGGKKSSTTNDSIKDHVLQSLVLLLRDDEDHEKHHLLSNNNNSRCQPESVLEVKQNGGSITAMFIPGYKGATRPMPLSSLPHELTPRAVHSLLGSKEQQTSPSSNPTSQTTCDLLGSLRDAFAEATQAEKGPLDLSDVLLIMKAAHLVYNSSSTTCRTDPSFVKAWSQYTSLLTDICPVSPALIGNSPKLVADVNLEYCSTMLVTYADSIGVVDKACLDSILAYLFRELKKCQPLEEASTKEQALFRPLNQILFISKRKNDAWAENAARRLVKEVANNFLGTDGKGEVSKDTVARSVVARKCTMLIHSFLEQCAWSIRQDIEADGVLLTRLVKGVGSFLASWGSDYLAESSLVISLLHQIVRRLDVTSASISKEEARLVEHIRSDLVLLVKQEKGKTSIFEAYPTDMQRKMLGLIVMLKAPPQPLLDGLAKICARSWRKNDNGISPFIASLAAQSIHNIRRTLSMQAYLGFITSSTGISGKPLKNTEKGPDAILRFDGSIALACQFLCQCGPTKVLPMLQPLLDGWLRLAEDTAPTVNQVLQARAATSVLGSFAARISTESSVLEIVPEYHAAIVTTTCVILRHLLSLIENTRSESRDSSLSAFLEPFVVLFQYEGDLFVKVFSNATGDIQSATITSQTSLVSALLVMVNDDRLSSVLNASPDLLKDAKVIEKTLVSSSAQQVAGRLHAAVELRCGSELKQ